MNNEFYEEYILTEYILTKDNYLLEFTGNELKTYNLNHSNDFYKIQECLNDISKQHLIKCKKENDNYILYYEDKKHSKHKIILRNYKKILDKLKLKKLNNKINIYFQNSHIKYIQKKLNIKFKSYIEKIPKKYIIVGSILTTSILIVPISTQTNKWETTKIPVKPGHQVTIQVNNSNNEAEETFNNNSNNELSFNELSNFTYINEYINFASKLYGVDIDTCYNLINDKINNMENYIINYGNSELKNIYNLKQQGIINGDLDIIGTFILIKNYAIDNLNIDNQEPIISNKTIEEKEKDIIDIAKYIYGIDDTETLNIIIAIHRLETGNGTSEYVINLNNFGGNMNANPSEEQINRYLRIIQPKNLDIENNPIPNIYKTAEIGEESMVRNFLNVYSKCLCDEECLKKANLAEFLSSYYCTHTPDEWAMVINDMLNKDTIQIAVNSYLNDNNNNDKIL